MTNKNVNLWSQRNDQVSWILLWKSERASSSVFMPTALKPTPAGRDYLLVVLFLVSVWAQIFIIHLQAEQKAVDAMSRQLQAMFSVTLFPSNIKASPEGRLSFSCPFPSLYLFSLFPFLRSLVSPLPPSHFWLSLSQPWCFCVSRDKSVPRQTASWPERPMSLWGSSCMSGCGTAAPQCCTSEGLSEEESIKIMAYCQEEHTLMTHY